MRAEVLLVFIIGRCAIAELDPNHCQRVAPVDVAGKVCPWQFGERSAHAGTGADGATTCVLHDGSALAPDLGGFVDATYPHGGYDFRLGDGVDLYGPACTTRQRPVPAEWTEGTWPGDVFFTPDEGTVQYHAMVGNGMIATELSFKEGVAAPVYMSGVFNGVDADTANREKGAGQQISDPAAGGDLEISHRAHIANPLGTMCPEVQKAGDATASCGNAGAALDVRRAVYHRRTRLPPLMGRPTVLLEQVIYAHRTRPSLLVVENSATWEGGPEEVVVDMAMVVLPYGPQSADFEALPTPGPSTVPVDGHDKGVHRYAGVTRMVETDYAKKVTVATAAHAPPTLTLRRGEAYVTAAAFRSSLDSDDPQQEALYDLQKVLQDCATQGAGSVRQVHEQEWARLWQSGFEVDRPDVAKAVNTSLYYIISSINTERPYSLSPGSLASNGYNGHTFWDAETWMYPPLLMWHPSLARSMLRYREDRLQGAALKAQGYNQGYKGNMFAWESAFSGSETCPVGYDTGRLEQHISGDIALAMQQYFYQTNDLDWLRKSAWDIASGIADFYVSRAELGADGLYHINGVIPPDEFALGPLVDGERAGVNDSIYTNFVAKVALSFATEVARRTSNTAKPEWAEVAAKLVQPYNGTLDQHPEYCGYPWGETVKQADVILLPYPLGMQMNRSTQLNDLEYYKNVTDITGPAMTWGAFCIGYLDSGELEKAAEMLPRSFANVKPPFDVWTETPKGGATNFITGAGGFLQTVLNGYFGVRIMRDKLRLLPVLMDGASKMVARGLWYQGCRFSASVDSERVAVWMEPDSACKLNVQEEDTGRTTQIDDQAKLTFAWRTEGGKRVPIVLHLSAVSGQDAVRDIVDASELRGALRDVGKWQASPSALAMAAGVFCAAILVAAWVTRMHRSRQEADGRSQRCVEASPGYEQL